MLRRVLIVTVALVSLALCSCADATPQVVSVTGAMVFDYADAEATPSTRLAIFVQMESDVQRASVIRARHTQTGYNWHVSSPQIFKSGDKQWACYTNLQPPEQQHIPTGTYDVQYIDAAGEDIALEDSFTVAYTDALFQTKAADIRSVLPNVTDTIALYDKNDVLIYFGKKKNNWSSNANILREYKAAITLRHCLATDDNTVVCLLPPEPLVEPSKEPNAGADND